MVNIKNPRIIEKIEETFDKDFNYSFADYKKLTRTSKKTPELRHLLWLPSLVYRKIYQILPKIIKDIFFCLSIIHKSPNTKIFARTK